MEDIVTSKSMALYRKLEVPNGFIEVDSGLWKNRDNYMQVAGTIKSLKVVSDHAQH